MSSQRPASPPEQIARDSAARVAAIVPVYNRRETTLQALRSLSRIDLTGIDFRIFIVDDGSTDGTAQAIEKDFPDVVLVHGDGNLHYAGGTNAGMVAAKDWNPDYYLLMNDDSVFHDQFLLRLLETARNVPRSVVGALLLLWDRPHRVFQVGLRWNASKGGWIIPEDLTAFSVRSEPFDVECLVGNCTLVPSAAVAECGLLDAQRFPHGWGDAQYFMRLRNAGWHLMVNPRAYVWCEPNTNPPPLHSQPLSKVFRILFRDRRHPLNLQRQFIARWESAPSRLSAIAAFTVYLAGILGKAATHGLSLPGTRASQNE
jgi:GT2 family glycosyltransferase